MLMDMAVYRGIIYAEQAPAACEPAKSAFLIEFYYLGHIEKMGTPIFMRCFIDKK